MSNSPDSSNSKIEEFDDADLVRLAQDGNLNAYDELIRRNHSRLYGVVYSMTRSHQDAEDLLQDIFVKAYDALRNFKGNSSFHTWVYRIAVNRTINFVKSRKLRQTISIHEKDADGNDIEERLTDLATHVTPEDEARRKEFRIKLNKALSTLSDNHRMVVIMHDMQGIPHDEIASILGLSSGTVRSRLFYARQALQAQLSEFKDEL